MDKLVSIITPAYNAEKSISSTIKSVLNQTYENWELIIVDDGSTDSTYEICSQYEKKDKRIRCYKIPNRGVSITRNTGIEYASGKYLTFLDADDKYEKDYISEMVSLMSDQEAEMGCCGYKIVAGDGNCVGNQEIKKSSLDCTEYYKAIDNMLEQKCFNILWNKIFITHIIKENHLSMNPTVSMGEDLLFVIEYMHYMKGRLVTSDKILYCYLMNPNGLQAAERNDNYARRISQWQQLKNLYVMKKYPVRNLDEELMRIIYTSILETNRGNRKSVLKTILASDEYRQVISERSASGVKNKIFMVILKTKNIFIISNMVNFFSLIKKISGRKITWS